MRKILFGLFMMAVVLSAGCKSKGGADEAAPAVGSPGCNCGH